ncbi:MAG: hypothetical protein BGN96_12465 [Bacteroidales bacterium 45-6]|uniref:P-loop NTPase fold protein n=1 Tax=uncultured Dysgonomonas sp. TaxID=206096 RepID=UPI0009623C0E|nr:P-loop NTPase fold protein [uncultured Dysgonomonas sp.]OJU55143.1 MAG: hypothetical protein BGN96_12465 [Bacteroidales bacterium 45-6]
MKEDTNNIEYPSFISNKPCGIDKFEGKSQERLTDAIANHIAANDSNKSNINLSRIIGLEGGWGVGKSNVVKLLKNHVNIKDNYHIFEYDAWGHQEDLQRRAFLETMTRDLIKDKVINNDWEQRLNDLLAHKVTRINKTLPKFDAGAFWTALFLALTPITVFLAERLENAKIVENIWYLISIAFAPILFGVILWLILMIFYKEMRSIGWLLQISKNETLTTKNTETINQKEPTVYDFKKWMTDISGNLGNKKLIIVYDNMDRLPAEKVKELWSSIHTFFSEDGFENVWTIIPFDEKHLSCAFGEQKEEKEQLTKYFISKTFPIVYRVTPPVITDFKKLFNKLFEEAFANTEAKQQDDINRIFRLEKQNATVRETIEFINQLVALKNIWQSEIDILYIAIFTLKKDLLLSNLNIADQILSGDYLDNNIPKIVSNNEILQKNISSLVYGVSLDVSEQIPMSKYIDSCFNLEENTDINRYANSDNFMPILSDKINNSDIAQINNIIQTLSQLNNANFSESNNNSISVLWNKIAKIKLKISLTKQEFDSFYQNILLHTSGAIQREVLEKLCKRIQQFSSESFSGKNYYIVLNQINDFIIEHKIEFDLFNIIQDKVVDSRTFVEYVIEAKEKYPLFKLQTNQNELDNYFTTLSPENNTWKQIKQAANQKGLVDYSHSYVVLIIRTLYKNKVYKFDKFLSQITQQIPNATATNFKHYLDIYKILSGEKPLKVQINPTQRQSFWNTIAANPDTPEYLEIITIQIANGANPSVNLNIEQTKYIAENIDYYATYGNLLINNISWNIPTLSTVLKYMTENKAGYILSLEQVLPIFFELKNNLSVTESVLLDQFNRWERFKDKITSANIQTLISNAQFFEFSKATKNTLTDYLNTCIVEALSEIQVEQLYSFLQQPTAYWTIVIQSLIETDFLKPLPDNLTEVGKRLLDDISASRLSIPSPNSILYKLIAKLDKRKTPAIIKDIRDKYCNSQYNISTQLFLFFEDWFENQGKLKDIADRATHRIIEPVINDTNCLNIIISKSDYYAEIIISAGDDATTLKDIIKNKIQSSNDDNLISFAKKIGIEKEQSEIQ